MTFKTLKPFETSLHAYSAKYVVARVFDVETRGAAFLKILKTTCMAIFTHVNFANIHICCASTITKLYLHAVTFTFTFVRMNCKFSIKHYPPILDEAFQGVEATGNMALKTGVNSLRKH